MMKAFTFGLLGLAAIAATAVGSIPAVAAEPNSQCMTDDGQGRLRPCSSFYKEQNPNWQSSSSCYTDDGQGRMRPCSSFAKPTTQEPEPKK